MRMLAFSHWGAQKSHRATPDTLDTRMDALIMDRCRSEQGKEADDAPPDERLSTGDSDFFYSQRNRLAGNAPEVFET